MEMFFEYHHRVRTVGDAGPYNYWILTRYKIFVKPNTMCYWHNLCSLSLFVGTGVLDSPFSTKF